MLSSTQSQIFPLESSEFAHFSYYYTSLLKLWFQFTLSITFHLAILICFALLSDCAQYHQFIKKILKKNITSLHLTAPYLTLLLHLRLTILNSRSLICIFFLLANTITVFRQYTEYFCVRHILGLYYSFNSFVK